MRRDWATKGWLQRPTYIAPWWLDWVIAGAVIALAYFLG